jgi:autotransporter adhesin
MNKTQRVVLKKQDEVSVGLCEARSRGLLKAGCSARRSRMGAALFVAVVPVSLLAVSQVSSAALVDNLKNVSSERAQVYSSQVREALSAITPSAGGASKEEVRRPAVSALSGPILTPDQMIVSGPTDSSSLTSALGTNAVAIGVNTHANGDYTVVAGSYASAAAGSVALGAGVSATGSESTALGVRTSVYSDHGLAVGWRTSVNADATDSLAIGSSTQVYSAAAGAIGKDNVVGGAGAYVIGNSNVASGAGSFVLGSNVTARGQNSIVLGANSDGSLDNVVSVGNVGTERRIVHVAPGLNPTDAVNMNQFNALGERANGLVAYDTANKNVVTLGGQAGAPAVVLTNLKAGGLSAQSSDAVNGAQLNATNSDVHEITSSLAMLTRA